MRSIALFLSLVLWAPLLIAQPPGVTVVPVTTLTADSAQVRPEGDRVTIIAKGLDPGSSPSIGITVELPNNFLEVYRLVTVNGQTFASFPPMVHEPSAPGSGEYLITAPPGAKLGIAIRSEALPVWFEITAPGAPDKPIPPEPIDGVTAEDLQAATDITTAAVKKLRDPLTQESLVTYLSAALQASEGTELQTTIELHQAAFAEAFLASPARPPFKDWKGELRNPLDALFGLAVVTAADYRQLMQAVIKALQETRVTEASEVAPEIPPAPPSPPVVSGVIKLYTRADCTHCNRWLAEIWPKLEKQGWKLDTITTPTGPVPRFMICDNNRCSPVHVGFMDVATFTALVHNLRR